MKVTLNRINDNFHFEGKGPTGVPVSIDDKTNGQTNGASPMELLLMALGGCSGIDMVSILKKQRQEISSYQTEIEGRRVEVKEARPFDAIHVKIILEGTIDDKKVND